MGDLPHCPQCQSTYTYEDRNLFVCPECGHEWSAEAGAADVDDGLTVFPPAPAVNKTADCFGQRETIQRPR